MPYVLHMSGRTEKSYESMVSGEGVGVMPRELEKLIKAGMVWVLQPINYATGSGILATLSGSLQLSRQSTRPSR